MIPDNLRRPNIRSKPFVMLVIFATSLLASCGAIDKARRATALGVDAAHQFNLEVLVEAETERQRLRRARCHSPLLNPAAIGAGAMDARLGRPWLDELLHDCPRFSVVVTQLVVERGLSLHELKKESSAASVAE